ncbi:MAG: hypothetical protein AAF633_10120 [Chloroflexota bacterium]
MSHVQAPKIYHIRVKGHLSPIWKSKFEGFCISLEENGETLISGPVVDQAALHGLLRQVRDAGLSLISVNPI